MKTPGFIFRAATLSGIAALLLRGPLGSGKTTLTRALVEALPGGDQAEVASPSFTLCNYYPTTPPVMHCDLYRSPGSLPDEIAEGLDKPEIFSILLRFFLESNCCTIAAFFHRRSSL